MHDIMTEVCVEKDDGGDLLGAYRISSLREGVPAGRHSPHHADLLMILKVGVEGDAPLPKRVSYSCTGQPSSSHDKWSQSAACTVGPVIRGSPSTRRDVAGTTC